MSAGAPHSLLVEVRLHEPRFHGRPEWPPSPARLFQALVAAAGPKLADLAVADAFRWLETQDAPIIGVPRHVEGRPVTHYVPNNDLDAKGGDPAEVASLRVAKAFHPRLLEPDVPLLYAWPVDERGLAPAGILAGVAEGLYQLGRGVDPAWARAAVVPSSELQAVLGAYPGLIHHPGPAAGGTRLASPAPGSLASLEARHAAQRRQFHTEGKGRKAIHIFTQAPKAHFKEVAYDCPPARLLYELRVPGTMADRARWPLERAHDLVIAVRDAAAARLRAALPHQADTVDAVLVGRRPGEPERVPTSQRVRIVPLPSIGHTHADLAVRRVLVEVPQGGPIRSDDVQWAFSGLEVASFVLVAADNRRMLDRYLGPPSRVWRSITPVALPARAARRRIDPDRIAEQRKDADERAREEAEAVAAVATALRHAGVRVGLEDVRVQREPWQGAGARAERSAAGERFPKERLWHVAITLDRPITGPLVLGDGRFLGLGLFVPDPSVGRRAAPVVSPVDGRTRRPAVLALRIVSGLATDPDPEALARSLRRAVMARAQAVLGAHKRLPEAVSGHARDGRPARDHVHLRYHLDAPRERLTVIAPDPGLLRDVRLDVALEGLTELRAGRDGLLTLAPAEVRDDDPLLAPSLAWSTLTPYVVRRHAKGVGAAAAVERDVRAACLQAGLPAPEEVRVWDVAGLPGRGVSAQVELRFAVAVPGPVVLGRTGHMGGGLFAGR